MQSSEQNAAGVTVVERINGWWVEEHADGGQRRLHGPYADEATARNEATLLGGVDEEVAVTLPAGGAVPAEEEARADQARELPSD